MRCKPEDVDLPQIDQHGVALVEVFTLLSQVPLVDRHVGGSRIDISSAGRIVPLEEGDEGDEPRGGWRETIRAARRAHAGLTLISTDELRDLVEQLRDATPVQRDGGD
jgi:hypothetical protein